MITKILNSYKNWRNKRAQLKHKAAWTKVYLDSVGHKTFSDNGFGEGRPNKEKHRHTWNRDVRPRSTYEMMQRTVSGNS